jgi:hypothetical protein
MAMTPYTKRRLRLFLGIPITSFTLLLVFNIMPMMAQKLIVISCIAFSIVALFWFICGAISITFDINDK